MCNVPFIFYGMWAIAKGWLDEKVRRKVQVHGSNFIDTLLLYIDADQLPECVGGTLPNDFMNETGPWNDYELIDWVSGDHK